MNPLFRLYFLSTSNFKLKNRKLNRNKSLPYTLIINSKALLREVQDLKAGEVTDGRGHDLQVVVGQAQLPQTVLQAARELRHAPTVLAAQTAAPLPQGQREWSATGENTKFDILKKAWPMRITKNITQKWNFHD